jgi:hypothetical protein
MAVRVTLGIGAHLVNKASAVGRLEIGPWSTSRDHGVVECDAPSHRVVEQRVRNRIIEYLELAASYERQTAYQAAAPVHVPYQVINWWEDWVPVDPRTDPTPLGVLSADERAALCTFQAVWEIAANALPNGYPALSIVQQLPEWDRLRGEASRALDVFALRGKMPEDDEIAD